MFRKWLSRLALTLVLALTMSTLVSAQGGALQFDTLTSGTHTGSPIIYTFTGNQDTIVTVYAIGGNGFTPIVNAPEVGILGVSKSQMKPVWDGSAFIPRLMLPLALSYDHRAINGGDAGRFMTHLVKLLSDIRYLAL